jgi:hypothetical protein
MKNLSMKDQPRLNGRLLDLVLLLQFHHSQSFRRKTGATVASRVQTGALKRRPKTLMKDLSNKWDLCSLKENRRDGAIDKFTQILGAMMRLRTA